MNRSEFEVDPHRETDDPGAWNDTLEAYLAGHLSSEAAKAVERSLSQPEVARALAEGLLLREMLRDDPALRVPEGLEARLLEPWTRSAEEKRSRSRLGEWTRVARALGWAWRGPGLAVDPARGTGEALSGARRGLGTIRFALAPLALLRRGR